MGQRDHVHFPRSAREAARRVASEKSISQSAIVASGVSEGTVKKLLNPDHPQTHFRASSLHSLARALGLTYERLLDPASPPRAEERHAAVPLLRDFQRVDDSILPLIRDLTVPSRLVDGAYESLLRDQLAAHGHNLHDVLALLEDTSWLENVRDGLPPPDLEVEVGREMSHLRFAFSEKQLTLEHPELLWDCHCGTPRPKPTKARCPIHSWTHHAELSARFGSGTTSLSYGDHSFRFKLSGSVWPPSIDSFWMIESLREAGELDAPHHSILDLGSGTGFLGICAAHEIASTAHVDFADWLLSPVLHSIQNWHLNRTGREHVTVRGKLGLLARWFHPLDRTYDLVLSNPPYLPLLAGCHPLGWRSTVAGTELLQFTILNAKALGRRVILQFSNIALPDAQAAAEAADATLSPLGAPRTVPFRVPLAFQVPEYLQLLIDKRGLEHRYDSRHPYWHSVATYAVE